MKKETLDTIFLYASRATIIIPIVIIVIAIALNMSTNNNKTQQKDRPKIQSYVKEKQSTSEGILEKIYISSPEGKFNLDGPYVCIQSPTPTPRQLFPFGKKAEENNQPTIKVYIKNKNIFVEKLSTQNEEGKYFLLKQDCVYIWDKGTYRGEKICGLTPYISLAETLSQYNFFGYNTFLSLISQFGDIAKFSSNSGQLESIIDSCKKEEIPDMSIFDLPNNVLFKNK